MENDPNLQKFVKGCPDHIFLSRGDSNRRKIENITELEQFLMANNYSIIDPSSLEIIQQILVTSNCKGAISEHGAHAINLMMAEKANMILELIPYPYIMTEWAKTISVMCRFLGLIIQA